MPRDIQIIVREFQNGSGSICRKEEVQPGGFEEGAAKENGPKRQVAGSSKGITSAQAI
jgi:hypothetical protein